MCCSGRVFIFSFKNVRLLNCKKFSRRFVSSCQFPDLNCFRRARGDHPGQEVEREGHQREGGLRHRGGRDRHRVQEDQHSK